MVKLKNIIIIIIIIIIINKFGKNIIIMEEKTCIWFEGIKNYKNLDKTSLIL
jgi:hypothetical protein